MLYAVAGGAHSRLLAINPNNGRIKWSFPYAYLSWPTVTGSFGAPGGQIIYVSSDRGAVLAIGPAQGKPLWTTWPAGRGGSQRDTCPVITSVTPAIAGGLVYITASNGRVYALSAQRGQVVWSTPIGDRSCRPTSIAVSASHLLIATGNAQVVSLDPRTGHRQWTYTQSSYQAKGITTGLAAAYGLVYVAGLGHGPHLLALDAASGQLSWTFVARDSVTLDPSVANGVLYVSDTRADLYAVDAKMGRRIALIGHLRGTRPTYPAIAYNWLYVSNYAFRYQRVEGMQWIGG